MTKKNYYFIYTHIQIDWYTDRISFWWKKAQLAQDSELYSHRKSNVHFLMNQKTWIHFFEEQKIDKILDLKLFEL